MTHLSGIADRNKNYNRTDSIDVPLLMVPLSRISKSLGNCHWVPLTRSQKQSIDHFLERGNTIVYILSSFS
jgi:hypothetical protein